MDSTWCDQRRYLIVNLKIQFSLNFRTSSQNTFIVSEIDRPHLFPTFIDYWPEENAEHKSGPRLCTRHVIALKPLRYFIFIPDCYYSYLMWANKKGKQRRGKVSFSKRKYKHIRGKQKRKKLVNYMAISSFVVFFSEGANGESFFLLVRKYEEKIYCTLWFAATTFSSAKQNTRNQFERAQKTVTSPNINIRNDFTPRRNYESLILRLHFMFSMEIDYLHYGDLSPSS